MASALKSFLFLGGMALIAAQLGVPEGLPEHSNGVGRSVLLHIWTWIFEPLQDLGGKYLVVVIGVTMVLLSILLPNKPSPPPSRR